MLIVDGQNNHDWQSTTDSLYATLKATNHFAVEVETAPQNQSIKGIRGPKADALKFSLWALYFFGKHLLKMEWTLMDD